MSELLQTDADSESQEGRLQALATDLEAVLGRHGFSVRNESVDRLDGTQTTYWNRDAEVIITLTPEPEDDGESA